MVETVRSGKTLTGLLKRRRVWIVGTIAAFLAGGDALAILTPPTFESSALMVIDQRVTSPNTDLTATVSTGQLLAAHYVKMATTRTVLDRVCQDAGGGCNSAALAKQVAVTTVKGTDLLAVKADDANPGRAASLANLLAARLLDVQHQEVANALKPTKSYLDGELTRLEKAMAAAKPPMLTALQAQYTTVSNRREAVAEQESRLDAGLSMVEAATVPTKGAYSRSRTFLLAGLLVGVVVASIIALLLDRLDTRIYGARRLAEATDAPLVLAC
ncbi:MAG: hypothetical protein E6I84_14375 [Chloroflexi bacterium]|nr:MAG: hypothetical protein E6I84_14375 [Chloroflexota bacterium]